MGSTYRERKVCYVLEKEEDGLMEAVMLEGLDIGVSNKDFPGPPRPGHLNGLFLCSFRDHSS